MFNVFKNNENFKQPEKIKGALFDKYQSNCSDNEHNIALYCNGPYKNDGNRLTETFCKGPMKYICNSGKYNKVFVLEPFTNSKFSKNFNFPNNVIFINIKNDYKTYKEYQEQVEKFLKENHIETLLFLRTRMIKGYKIDDLSKIEDMEKHLEKDPSYCYTFVSIFFILSCYTVIKAAANICNNIYQFIIDPLEPNFEGTLPFKNYKRYYYLEDKRPNQTSHYCPWYEHEYVKDYKPKDKQYNLTFICTIVSDERNYIYEQKDLLMSIPDSKVNIVKKDEMTTGFLPYSEYMDYISKSKYTIIIPSYDIGTFSIARFLEALAHDCLGICIKDVCLDSVKDTFPDIYEIIRYNLIVDSYEDIKTKILNTSDEERLNIIKQLKNTESYKNFEKDNFGENIWSNIF